MQLTRTTDDSLSEISSRVMQHKDMRVRARVCASFTRSRTRTRYAVNARIAAVLISHFLPESLRICSRVGRLP